VRFPRASSARSISLLFADAAASIREQRRHVALITARNTSAEALTKLAA
jgi:hypothetical protein